VADRHWVHAPPELCLALGRPAVTGVREVLAEQPQLGLVVPTRFRALAQYRDFDGHTRQVEGYGKSATAAANNLRQKLKERSQKGRSGELTAMHRFSDAAELWMDRFAVMVADGRRSAGSIDTYQGQLDKHVLPALGEVRLSEATTPLVDKVIAAIKTDTGAATAKTCRSVISGVMLLIGPDWAERQTGRRTPTPLRPSRPIQRATDSTWPEPARRSPHRSPPPRPTWRAHPAQHSYARKTPGPPTHVG
jgi:hypothetical protein